MSVIVGVWDEAAGVCFLGSDSRVSEGAIFFDDMVKLHMARGMGFGFAGSVGRMQEAARLVRKSRSQLSTKDNVESFIHSICAGLDERFEVASDDDDLVWMVATRWGIASVSNQCVLWRREMADGSGQELALGSLHATAKFPGVTAEERVRYAVEAACQYSPDCGLPVHVIKVGAP